MLIFSYFLFCASYHPVGCWRLYRPSAWPPIQHAYAADLPSTDLSKGNFHVKK
jgi:hypothetical protein